MSDGDERDTTIARLTQENDRLRAENGALRPRVSDLEHRLRILTRHHEHEHHPHDLPPSDTHG
jgi:regulator of replication initiation timing